MIPAVTAAGSAARIRVAAVDCGTNSLRLLIADLDPAAGTLTEVRRQAEIVRLGEGVDRTGRLAPQAVQRAFAVLRDYAALCSLTGVRRVRFAATSAMRDARNGEEFVAGVQGLLGVEPEVLSGEQEALLSFVGATRGLAATGADDGVLVVDLGGGSTEFVLGTASGVVQASRSVDVGSVRLTERHLPGDPPSSAQVEAARADVAAALDVVAAGVPLARARVLVGVAGTVTTITAHALRLPRYDSARVHGAVLAVQDVIDACTELLTMPRAERAMLGFLHPGRVDVIGAGALLWREVLERVRTDAGVTQVATSEHDILDGLAWSLAGVTA